MKSETGEDWARHFTIAALWYDFVENLRALAFDPACGIETITNQIVKREFKNLVIVQVRDDQS